MTLNKIQLWAKREFNYADEEFITDCVNELEHRIVNEILVPAGIEHREEGLDRKGDLRKNLLLPNEHFNLYTAYIAMNICAHSNDGEMAEFYSALFDNLMSMVKAEYRRKYVPVKDVKIRGNV